MTKPWNFLQQLVFNFGRELANNPTQYMMERAFEHHGLNWRYVQFEFGPEKLAEAVQAMRVLEFRGGNCTIPYKVAIVEHLDGLGKSASLMGAVNCVVRRGVELIGENTDGKGFLQSFREVADPSGKSFVILGAGGAARAIAVESALAGAKPMTIVNRGRERGEALAALLQDKVGVAASYQPWSADFVTPEDADVLINATSIGMSDADARVPILTESLRPETIVADVIVDPPNTRLLRDARCRGCTVLDGLGMVVNQAMIAFEHWTDVRADRDVMKKALKEVLGVD